MSRAPADCGSTPSGENAPRGDVAISRDLILDAMARLSTEQRAVIRCSYYDALTTAQIADQLHIDENAVKSRLHSGVRALLGSLREHGVADI